MRQVMILILCLFFFPLCAMAKRVESPDVKPNDSWVYKSTVERGQNNWKQEEVEYTVVRSNSDSILVSLKQKGSPQPPTEMLTGPDWSKFRNINGKEQTVNRPFSFPLEQGKTWEIEYTENHPNKEHRIEVFHTTYRVVGWEEVEVPAGRFKALKVESDGNWKAQLEPTIKSNSSAQMQHDGATLVTQTHKVAPQWSTGRTYKAFWYAPEIKRFVKSVEEYYSSGGVRNERYTMELISYQVSE